MDKKYYLLSYLPCCPKCVFPPLCYPQGYMVTSWGDKSLHPCCYNSPYYNLSKHINDDCKTSMMTFNEADSCCGKIFTFTFSPGSVIRGGAWSRKQTLSVCGIHRLPILISIRKNPEGRIHICFRMYDMKVPPLLSEMELVAVSLTIELLFSLPQDTTIGFFFFPSLFQKF